MVAINKFDVFADDLCKKVHNLNTDILKILLSDTLPVHGNAVTADITQIAGGNGYTTGGLTVTQTLSTSLGTETLAIASLTITASGGAIAQWRYPVLVNTTANRLMWWWDAGSEINLAIGATETLTFANTTLA